MISPDTKDTLEALSYLATMIGIPLALLVYWRERVKDREGRENDAFVVSGEKYTEYLVLCLEHPELDGFDLAANDPAVVASGLPYRKLILFTILISMLETAFLRYQKQSTSLQRKQRSGWRDYMHMWARREDFRQAWPLLGAQFDTDFVRAMDRIMETEARTADAVVSANAVASRDPAA